MNTLLEQIKKKNAKAFTHSGKFHADDVFSYALLLYLNPAITITRGNKVPKDFDGIVFDIGRGKYDHHQKDSRIRENGIPYAAFGLLWEELGKEILGEELAAKFDESFIQPLDNIGLILLIVLDFYIFLFLKLPHPVVNINHLPSSAPLLLPDRKSVV